MRRGNNAAAAGKITKEQAQANIEELHHSWAQICRGQFENSEKDNVRKWKRFTAFNINKLAKLKMPVL